MAGISRGAAALFFLFSFLISSVLFVVDMLLICVKGPVGLAMHLASLLKLPSSSRNRWPWPLSFWHSSVSVGKDNKTVTWAPGSRRKTNRQQSVVDLIVSSFNFYQLVLQFLVCRIDYDDKDVVCVQNNQWWSVVRETLIRTTLASLRACILDWASNVHQNK